MQCNRCGAEIDDDSIFCPKCGQRLSDAPAEGGPSAPLADQQPPAPSQQLQPPVQQPSYRPSAQGSTDGMAVAGLICGISGIFIAPIILSTMAIIFGAMSYSRVDRGTTSFKFAITAIILGIVGLVSMVLMMIILFRTDFFDSMLSATTSAF